MGAGRQSPGQPGRAAGRGPHRARAGFTLIELMLVLVVLTIVATATMSRLGLHTTESAYRQYTADVYDTVLAARARAIDDQTQVFLVMRADGVDLDWIDPDSGARENLWVHRSKSYGSGVLEGSMCNGGLYNGVVAPGETSAAASLQCVTDSQELLFFPDGSFSYAAQQNVPAGVTLMVAHEKNGVRNATIIEVFPGGNVRKTDNVQF